MFAATDFPSLSMSPCGKCCYMLSSNKEHALGELK